MTEHSEIIVPEKVREKFDSRRGKGAYERWLKRFLRNCNTFVQIGKDEGITGQGVRKIYLKHFAPYLPHETGLKRRRACTLHKIHMSFKRAEQQFQTKALKHITDKAKKQGCAVSIVPWRHCQSGKNTWKPRVHELLINEMLCHVDHYKCKGPAANVVIGVSTASFWQYAFFIFYLDVKSFDRVVYIIPKEVLRDAPLCISKRGKKVFVLPLNERRGKKPKVDWRQYRNAWHLLETAE